MTRCLSGIPRNAKQENYLCEKLGRRRDALVGVGVLAEVLVATGSRLQQAHVSIVLRRHGCGGEPETDSG